MSLFPVPSVGELRVNLDHAPNEELLLFGCGSLPIVRLGYCDSEARVASPLFVSRFLLVFWDHIYVILDGRQVVHFPSFANREGAICILSGFVQFDVFLVVDGYYDDARLFVCLG